MATSKKLSKLLLLNTVSVDDGEEVAEDKYRVDDRETFLRIDIGNECSDRDRIDDSKELHGSERAMVTDRLLR
jgi:hypothetical protein